MGYPPEGPKRVFRIVSARYPPFDGGGAYRWGSRWVSPGSSVVHAAETFALAVLENLVHWQTGTLPHDLVCVRATIPAEVAQEWTGALDPAALTSGDYRAARRIGDDWYRRREAAVLWVPSVVSPYEANVLFNQRHADFSRIVVEEPVPAHRMLGCHTAVDGTTVTG